MMPMSPAVRRNDLELYEEVTRITELDSQCVIWRKLGSERLT